MASKKISFKQRWETFYQQVKANSTIIGDKNNWAFVINKTVFINLLDSVKDFVGYEEYEERLKPYRTGKYLVSYAVNRNSFGRFEMSFAEEETANVELREDMISNLRQFGNGGFFTITIDGNAYNVKYDNSNKMIETEAPAHIKKAIIEWWFI